VAKPRRILLVEDEYMIAQDMAYELQALGADVIGPAPSVERALRLIEEDPAIDTGFLDINLNGERAYPIAEALLARGIRVVFTTGYDEAAIDPRFADVPRCSKPVTRLMLKQMLGACES
jgi:DNA-binding NarL/FixJ family response regulator